MEIKFVALLKMSIAVTDEALLSLYSIFGENTTRSLELLDTGKFYFYENTNGLRKLLKIKSKSEEYTLFHSINYCPCLAFKYQVLSSRKAITCKHVLAGKLAEISGIILTEKVTDEQLSDLIKNLVTTECDT